MTEKELKNAKQECRRLKKKYEKLYEEIQCRDMINSHLAYSPEKDFITESQYSKDYIETLGMERVQELYADQKRDFAEAVVLRNVFTDGEGLSYNRIVWADEFQIPSA